MTENKIKFSIQFKFFIIVGSIIIFICSSLVFFFVTRSSNELYREIEKRGLTEVKSLARHAKYGVLIEDEVVLNKLIGDRIIKPDIAYIKIIRVDESLLAAGRKEGYAFLYDEDKKVVHLEEGISRSSLISETGENIYEFIAPLMTGEFINPEKEKEFEDALLLTDRKTESLPLTLGTVKVGITLKDVNRKMKETISISMIIISLVVAIALFVSYYFVRFIVRPIKEVTQAAMEISKGDLTKSVYINSSDETGQLAASFNKMTEDLQKVTVSRDYVDNIIKSMTDTLIVVNPDSTIKTVNHATCNLLGYREDELTGKLVSMIFATKEEELSRRSGIEDLIEKGFITGAEKSYLSKDGAIIPVIFSGSVMYNEQGKVQGIVCVALDITERKRMDEQIKASLKEKEALLQEVHHRVKNNMQIISSLLKLQSRYIKDKRSIEIFEESQNRIQSMALVHEKLYQSEDLSNTDIKDYIKNLASRLFRSYRINASKITLKMDVADVSLGIDTAIPCGLIINELISNSLKHAFPEDKKGEVRISIHSIDKNRLELIVSDNGVGIPEDMDFRNTKSLGLQLVPGIVENQLEGEIELDRTEGTRFKIRFNGAG